MGLSDLLKRSVGRTLSVVRHRSRRVWAANGRVHVELHPMRSSRAREFAQRLDELTTGLDGVDWADVNAFLRRAILAYDPERQDPEALAALVADIEREIGIDPAGSFPQDIAEHPGDIEPVYRALGELGADLVAVGLGLALRLSKTRLLPVEIDLAALLSILDGVPHLRLKVEKTLGRMTTELTLALATAVANGLAQRPVGPLVDACQRGLRLRELLARRATWLEREPELCQARAGYHKRPDVPPRPCPLPPGAIERYADKAWFASLGAFGLGLTATGNLEGATTGLIAGLPKPGRLGVEAFAAALGHKLARRGLLVLDDSVLRLLDRIDTIVVQGELLDSHQRLMDEVVPLAPDADAAALRARADALYVPSRPLARHADGPWSLAPLADDDGDLDATARARVVQLRASGAATLVLRHDGAPRALIGVRPRPVPGVEPLLDAIRDAGLDLVVAGDELTAEHAGARCAPGDDADCVAFIRELQRDGHAVAVIARGREGTLAAADCGIGLYHGDEAPPWYAHVISRDGLADAALLVDAIAVAKVAAYQGVVFSYGGVAAGAWLGFGGLGNTTPTRVADAMNVAALLSMANGLRHAARVGRAGRVSRPDPTPWHALDPDAVLDRLASSLTGLAPPEASARRHVPEPPLPAAWVFADMLKDELSNPLTPLLAGGAGLSAVVGSVADAAMVGGVMALNAVVGAAQRFRTDRAITALGQRRGQRVCVRRGGAELSVDPAELVAGDLVSLRAGEVVPADCRIIEALALEVDESSLTGESLPVRKDARATLSDAVADRSSMLYEGTSIAAGEAKAVVVAVGGGTELGRGYGSAANGAPESGVEARLTRLTELTAPLSLLAGGAIAVTGLLRGRPVRDVVNAGVSLAVAAVPEGLPIIATVAQLGASRRLAEHGALVRNPRSIEALGRVDVLCADKTGTLTAGIITLRSVSDGVRDQLWEDLDPALRRVLSIALRASPEAAPGDELPHPTDQSLIDGAHLAGVDVREGGVRFTRKVELPFEPARGYHAVLGVEDGVAHVSVKGAPEVILPRCAEWARDGQRGPLDEAGRDALDAHARSLARQGLRVLAVAERRGGRRKTLNDKAVDKLTFIGFVALADPVRPSAAAAVSALRRAGVEVVMITGDHPSTAERIASELDLLNGHGVVTGPEIDALDDDGLAAILPRVCVFARVTPAHKARIVKAFQRAGRVVAMTGDGANDAPAIRLADAGIALGAQSTPAARAAADLLVLDECIETIVEAVLEGRAMWRSVRDAVAILVGGNLGEIGYTLIGSLLGGASPLNARQLLLVNLLTDVAPAMAIALRRPRSRTPEVLISEGPDASLGDALTRDILCRAIATGAAAGSAWVACRLGDSRGANTTGLVALVGTQLAQTLVSGGLDKAVVATSLASAGLLTGAVQTPGVSGFFGCRPLGPLGWTIAGVATVGATGLSLVLPPIYDRLAPHLRDSKLAEWLGEVRLPWMPPATDAPPSAQGNGHARADEPPVALHVVPTRDPGSGAPTLH